MILRKEFQHVSKFTDDETSRYALGGVLLERDVSGRPHAVATDGRRMVVVSCGEPDAEKDGLAFNVDCKAVDDFKAIIQSSDFIDACKMAPTKKAECDNSAPFVALEEPTANGTVKLQAGTKAKRKTIEFHTCEGRFPNSRQVIPKHSEATSTIVVDLRYLRDVAEVLLRVAPVNYYGTPSVAIDIKDSDSPIVFRRLDCAKVDDVEATAVLMPLLADKKGDDPAADLERKDWQRRRLGNYRRMRREFVPADEAWRRAAQLA